MGEVIRAAAAAADQIKDARTALTNAIAGAAK
jgi:hypothetical protein